ncbi:MAG: hypothetical protein CL844_02970 [Crocinitomicaceae bacterium]|nr:hypothetical protein [Crocinitomicaceae bacterium]|tara:strand:- start:13568 stop:13834 length:267 start_codon:yes stop_codon:yes gene_type:complete
MSDHYQKLSQQLKLEVWPSVYLFKFIMPNDSDLIRKVIQNFDKDAIVTSSSSKTAKYIAISIKQMMMNSDIVIEKYKQISKLKGVISL